MHAISHPPVVSLQLRNDPYTKHNGANGQSHLHRQGAAQCEHQPTVQRLSRPDLRQSESTDSKRCWLEALSPGWQGCTNPQAVHTDAGGNAHRKQASGEAEAGEDQASLHGNVDDGAGNAFWDEVRNDTAQAIHQARRRAPQAGQQGRVLCERGSRISRAA